MKSINLIFHRFLHCSNHNFKNLTKKINLVNSIDFSLIHFNFFNSNKIIDFHYFLNLKKLIYY